MNKICEHDGCDRRFYGHGKCHLHYQRWRAGQLPAEAPEGEKSCRKCSVVKPLTEFGRHAGCSDGFRPDCKECHAQYHKDQREKNSLSKYREPELRKKYGISLADYEAMLQSQDGGCAICHVPEKEAHKASEYLCVDHDHATGKVRGLLCSDCNRGLGCFRDTPALLTESAKYLLKRRD